MSSEAKIIANRRNAAKSTGPKSALGKQRSRMNASKHGLYSNPAHLPAEDLEAHAHLLAELEDFWQPQGPTERVLLGQIASMNLELIRVTRGYDLHRNDTVRRAAISRVHKADFQIIRDAYGESLEGARQATHDIAKSMLKQSASLKSRILNTR